MGNPSNLPADIQNGTLSPRMTMLLRLAREGFVSRVYSSVVSAIYTLPDEDCLDISDRAVQDHQSVTIPVSLKSPLGDGGEYFPPPRVLSSAERPFPSMFLPFSFLPYSDDFFIQFRMKRR